MFLNRLQRAPRNPYLAQNMSMPPFPMLPHEKEFTERKRKDWPSGDPANTRDEHKKAQ